MNGNPIEQNRSLANSIFYYAPVPTEKSLIRRSMTKVSGAILITHLIMYLVVMALNVITLSFNIKLSSASASLILYISSGLSSAIALPIGMLILSKMLSRNVSGLIPIKKLKLSKSLFLIFASLAICMISNYAVDIFATLFNSIGWDIMSGVSLEIPQASAFNIAVLILTTALVPAIVEELLFRGVILNSLTCFGKSFAIVISSVLFGLLHGNFVQTPFAVVVGIALAYLTVYTGSIIPAMIVHFLNNSMSVVFSVLQRELYEVYFSVIYLGITVVLLIIGLVGIYSLSKSDKDFLRLKDEIEPQNSLRKRITVALCEPVTIIFTALMIISCFSLIIIGG